jgi:hypothetical protein
MDTLRIILSIFDFDQGEVTLCRKEEFHIFVGIFRDISYTLSAVSASVCLPVCLSCLVSFTNRITIILLPNLMIKIV